MEQQAQFTCFTSTKVQILTPEEEQSGWSKILCATDAAEYAQRMRNGCGRVEQDLMRMEQALMRNGCGRVCATDAARLTPEEEQSGWSKILCATDAAES
jgi:ferredoxin